MSLITSISGSLAVVAALALSALAPGQTAGRASETAPSIGALHADRLQLTAGQALEVFVAADAEGPVRGAHGRAPWRADPDWLFVRVAGTQENVPEAAATLAGGTAAPFTLTRAGITLVAVDHAPRVVPMPAAGFEEFLARRVGEESLPAGWRDLLGEGELRVRRLESSKLLVRVVDGKGWLPNSATAQSKTGQRVEIRPLADPTSTAVKSDLPLRIYVPPSERKDVGKRGTKVIATHVATGRTQSFLTDSVSAGFFAVTMAGVWRVETHHARPLSGDPEADWEVHTATLTFEVASIDPREGAPDVQGRDVQREGEER